MLLLGAAGSLAASLGHFWEAAACPRSHFPWSPWTCRVISQVSAGWAAEEAGGTPWWGLLLSSEQLRQHIPNSAAFFLEAGQGFPSLALVTKIFWQPPVGESDLPGPGRAHVPAWVFVTSPRG